MKKQIAIIMILFVGYTQIVIGQIKTGQVVISEVMYDTPSNERQPFQGHEGEFVELFNSSAENIDISGWKIRDKHISRRGYFTFSANTIISGGGFLIIAYRNIGSNYNIAYDDSRFNDGQVIYQSNFVLMNHSGETLELINKKGEIEDYIAYNTYFYKSFYWDQTYARNKANLTASLTKCSSIQRKGVNSFYREKSTSPSDLYELKITPFSLPAGVNVELQQGIITGNNISSTENYVYTFTAKKPIKESELNLNNVSLEDGLQSISYYDGLGRLKQIINIQAGANKQDVIQHVAYDGLGRIEKEFLPYSKNENYGKYIKTAESDQLAYYSDVSKVFETSTNPFSQKVFDGSPLNKVIEQAAPGDIWELGNGHTIKFKEATNIMGEVRLWEVKSDGSLSSDSHYAKNQLWITIIKDENWTLSDGNLHTTKEYKDKLGKVVLKRTYVNSDELSTYYVYDVFGNLRYVIPPLANGDNNTISTDNLNKLCYQYKYDERNRLIEKQIPGKGAEYIVYDKADRPILTQDVLQKARGEWLFTKYDALGRVILTGLYEPVVQLDRSDLQFEANKLSTIVWEERDGSSIGYTVTHFPKLITGSHKIYTKTYYDNYDYLDSDMPTIPTSVYNQKITTRTKGLVTGSWIKVMDGINTSWNKNYIFYDEKARPVRTYSKNWLGGYDIIDIDLNFIGEVKNTTTKHRRSSTGAELVILNNFDYDHTGRLLKQSQTINGQEEVIAENKYTELGELKSKEVGNNIQKVDYKYNIRGWLTQINNVDILNDDLFAFELSYDTPHEPGSELYNGNISQTRWKTANTDSAHEYYTYHYDALNRLTSAIHNTGNYNLTNVKYDLNGNINSLERSGIVVNMFNEIEYDGIIDNLSYNYTGNRLISVTDIGADNNDFQQEGFYDGNETGSDYIYDANGNLIKDRNKHPTHDFNIKYNHLNLPEKVEVGANKIVYIYDASGVKLQKQLIEGGSLTKTVDYLGAFQYENNTLQFISQPEGYVYKDDTGYRYVYQYKDHLGNNRLSFMENAGSVAIVDENNYYPFGLTHKGYNSVTSGLGSSAAKKYKYNGKELQNEIGLGMYDYGARHYDPALGRWFVVDPLADQMRRHSPYNYAFDNPIYFIDPDGMAPFPNPLGLNPLGAIAEGFRRLADATLSLFTIEHKNYGKKSKGVSSKSSKVEVKNTTEIETSTTYKLDMSGVMDDNGHNKLVLPSDVVSVEESTQVKNTTEISSEVGKVGGIPINLSASHEESSNGTSTDKVEVNAGIDKKNIKAKVYISTVNSTNNKGNHSSTKEAGLNIEIPLGKDKEGWEYSAGTDTKITF